MGVGSGIGAQMAAAAETTYGTYVAPNRAYEFTKQSLALRKQTAQSGGIAAGRLLDRASRRVLTTADAGGTWEMEVTNKLMGLLFQGLFGTSVTPVQQAATTAYLQTHTMIDVFGKSLTIQAGLPLTTGTVSAKSFVGCKIISAEFACETSGMLTVSLEIDAKDCVEGQTLVVATYPDMSPFHFGQMAVRAGTYGSEAALDGVRKVSVKIERPQAVDRYYAGQAGRKKEPITNDKVKITGSLEVDYVDTVLDALNTSDGATSFVWEFLGPIIASTYNETFRLTLPAIKLDGEPPQVDGPAVVKPTWSFTGLDDASHSVKLEYMSVDTTV